MLVKEVTGGWIQAWCATLVSRDNDKKIQIYSCVSRKQSRVVHSCGRWWRHQMESFSALLPFVWGIHRSPRNSPHKGQWRSFDAFFDLRLNIRLSKQSGRRWFETPSRSLWRHYNENIKSWGILQYHWLIASMHDELYSKPFAFMREATKSRDQHFMKFYVGYYIVFCMSRTSLVSLCMDELVYSLFDLCQVNAID